MADESTQEIKERLVRIETLLEVNVKDLERSQNILEQSLAYINRYLVEKD